MKKKKVLFIDRDGTLIAEHFPTEQIDSFEKLMFMPKVFNAMKKIVDKTDFMLVMVSNQDGLGTEIFPEDTFWPVHNFVMKAFENEGVYFAKQHIDRHFVHENSLNRKPGIGMLTEYFSEEYNLAASFVIGDRYSDVELAKNLGAKAIYIGKKENLDASLYPYLGLVSEDWQEIADFLILPQRKATVSRKTKETDIQIAINLDGTGTTEINTGLHFFDHMLEQLGRHSGIDLKIEVKGDLQVDEHHTIEDTAIALGEAFNLAIADKLGMMRYGFALPMDDCMAQVAIDFGGRPWVVWDVEFKREKVGDMPTEMFFHFFKSFSDSARCNLNIKAEGDNEHHKIESIFKALARCIKVALKRDSEKYVLPSTKGLL